MYFIENSTGDPMSGTGLDALGTMTDASGTKPDMLRTVTHKNSQILCGRLLF